MPLLILPLLAHLLMGAHLMFHGAGLAAFLVLIPVLALFIPRPAAARTQRLLLVLWSAEWIRAGVLLVMGRMAEGRPWTAAACIMGGVAACTLLAAFVFSTPRLRRFYKLSLKIEA